MGSEKVFVSDCDGSFVAILSTPAAMTRSLDSSEKEYR
jgi:hypothetical protein